MDDTLVTGEPMFFGEYFHTLDEKGRVAVPAKCRNQASFVDGRETWYITRGFEQCLMVFTAEAWQRMMEENLSSLSMGNKEHRVFIRNFVSPAVESQADKQGRILLPQHLRDYANIGRDVTLLGAGKYLEIWDREKFAKEQAENEDIEAIGEKLAEFGL